MALYPVSSSSSRIAACSAVSPSSIRPERRGYEKIGMPDGQKLPAGNSDFQQICEPRKAVKKNEVQTDNVLPNRRSVLFDDDGRRPKGVGSGSHNCKNGDGCANSLVKATR